MAVYSDNARSNNAWRNHRDTALYRYSPSARLVAPEDLAVMERLFAIYQWRAMSYVCQCYQMGWFQRSDLRKQHSNHRREYAPPHMTYEKALTSQMVEIRYTSHLL